MKLVVLNQKELIDVNYSWKLQTNTCKVLEHLNVDL